MTQRVNEKIHTCTKCGTLVYAFVEIEPPQNAMLWLAGGLLLGVVGAALFDRRQ
jgi:hypothetical protein